MLCKNKVVGRELKGSEKIGRDYSGHTMQVHLVKLGLLSHFVEELDDKNEDVPINGG